MYTASATITDASSHTYATNQVQAGASAIISAALDNTTTTSAVGSADTTIAWTNAISVVSPTGYVSRFAPYALMLIGGIVLLIVAKKHKKHKTDEE